MEKEDIDLKWLGKIVNENGYDVSKLISSEMTPAVTEGENYVSKIYRLAIDAVSNDARSKKLSLILKRKVCMDLGSEDMQGKLEEAFNHEYRVYKDILSKLNQYLPNGQQMWPNCLATIPNRDIYFEDLKTSGYRLADRHVGLDFEQTSILINSLARLHASSCIAVDKGEIDLSSYKKYLMLGSGNVDHQVKTSEFKQMTDVMLIEWGPGWEETAKELNLYKDTLPQTVYNLGEFEESRLNVFNHGDTWVNNFMYCYDSNDKLKSLKFVDFQIAHYNTPAFDLCYLFSTSIPHNLKKAHMETWIRDYCNTFKLSLQQNGSSLPSPTPQMIKDEMLRLTPFSLQTALRVRPIIMSLPEHRITIEDMVQDSDAVETKKRKLYTNPKYIEVMKSDLPEFLASMKLLNK